MRSAVVVWLIPATLILASLGDAALAETDPAAREAELDLQMGPAEFNSSAGQEVSRFSLVTGPIEWDVNARFCPVRVGRWTGIRLTTVQSSYPPSEVRDVTVTFELEMYSGLVSKQSKVSAVRTIGVPGGLDPTSGAETTHWLWLAMPPADPGASSYTLTVAVPGADGGVWKRSGRVRSVADAEATSAAPVIAVMQTATFQPLPTDWRGPMPLTPSVRFVRLAQTDLNRTWPAVPIGYDGFDAIVIPADIDGTAIPPAQQQALREWLLRGGYLVLGQVGVTRLADESALKLILGIVSTELVPSRSLPELQSRASFIPAEELADARELALRRRVLRYGLGEIVLVTDPGFALGLRSGNARLSDLRLGNRDLREKAYDARIDSSSVPPWQIGVGEGAYLPGSLEEQMKYVKDRDPDLAMELWFTDPQLPSDVDRDTKASRMLLIERTVLGWLALALPPRDYLGTAGVDPRAGAGSSLWMQNHVYDKPRIPTAPLIAILLAYFVLAGPVLFAVMKRAGGHHWFPVAVGAVATATCVLLWLYGSWFFGFGDVERVWRCNAVLPGQPRQVLRMEGRLLQAQSQQRIALARPVGDRVFSRPVWWESGSTQKHSFTADASGAWCGIIGQQVRAPEVHYTECVEQRDAVPTVLLISSDPRNRRIVVDNPTTQTLRLVAIGRRSVDLEVQPGSRESMPAGMVEFVSADADYVSGITARQPARLMVDQSGARWLHPTSQVSRGELAAALAEDLFERYRDIPVALLVSSAPAEPDRWHVTPVATEEYWAVPVTELGVK